MNLKSLINNLLVNYRYNGARRGYAILYRRIIEHNELSISGFKWGQKKWSKYDKKLSPLSYQIFSRYIGEDVNIIPLEILAGIVEPILTPEPFKAQYGDKNNFDRLYKDVKKPETLVRNINGLYLDKSYKTVESPLDDLINNHPVRIILKPTREMSGRGVRLFVYQNGHYVDSEKNILSKEYLDNNYTCNFIIQEAISQCPYLSQFNSSSVNTLRVATYRSVITGDVHVINAVLRIGASGKDVDNAHSGGMFTGINKSDGTVGNYVCDWLGHKETIFNGVDFSRQRFQIPRWDAVCQFAKNVSEQILFGNLVALDIALDENGGPILIEANVGDFSGWLYQFTTGSVFGEFTDEIMAYCWGKYKNIKCSLILNN